MENSQRSAVFGCSAPTASTSRPSRTKSCPCTIPRAASATPPTHMTCCWSSMTATGTNTTLFAASTVRTPSSPDDENGGADSGPRPRVLVGGAEAQFGLVADVDAVQIALAPLDDRNDRVERDDLRDLLPGERQ